MVIFHGSGVVWDPDKNKVLCKFVNGIYETDDAREIAILAKAFPFDGELPVEEPPAEIGDDGEPVKRPRGRPRNA